MSTTSETSRSGSRRAKVDARIAANSLTNRCHKQDDGHERAELQMQAGCLAQRGIERADILPVHNDSHQLDCARDGEEHD